MGQSGKFISDKDYLIKGKYILIKFCKGGAFGEVFFARHAEKNYEVAIKFVSIQVYIKISEIIQLNPKYNFNSIE